MELLSEQEAWGMHLTNLKVGLLFLIDSRYEVADDRRTKRY